jgi:hypothetical protein
LTIKEKPMRSLILTVCVLVATVVANAQGGSNRPSINPIQFFEERVLAEPGSPQYVAMTYIYVSCVTGLLIATKDEEKVSEDMLHSCLAFSEQSVQQPEPAE